MKKQHSLFDNSIFTYFLRKIVSVSNYQNSCHKLPRLYIKTKMAQCDLPSWLFTSSKWTWISLIWMIFNLNGFPAKIIPKWRQITTRFLFILYHKFIVLTYYSVICCYVGRIIKSIWRAQVFFLLDLTIATVLYAHRMIFGLFSGAK